MDNGNIDAASAATLALLADTSRAGRGGYGGYGGEGGGGGPMYGGYAGHSANAVRVECNGRAQDLQSTAIANQVRDNAMASRFSDLESRAHQAEIAQMKCCCETQKQIAESESRTADRLAAATIVQLQNDNQNLRLCANNDTNTHTIIQAIQAGNGNGGGHWVAAAPTVVAT